jgi:thiazole synthase
MDLLGTRLRSRLFLGTGRYPSLDRMTEVLRAARPGLITVALRRPGPAGESPGAMFEALRELDVPLLPNTAGCHTVSEAVETARMARELFETPWIKLEVIGSKTWLEPDSQGLVEAATILADEGFTVFPYMTEDLSIAERLLRAGCPVLMPWAAPIGSGRGLEHRPGLRRLRQAFPGVPMIVDAGLGLPSQAAEAMELGFDAVLLNTAVAGAADPHRMGLAFSHAVEAGRLAFEAGPMPPRRHAFASTTETGKASLG